MSSRLIYDYRAVTVTINSVTTLVQILPPNRNRVSYLVSSIDATGNYGFSFSGSFNDLFAQFSGPFSERFTYRDFGPLVREALFCSLGIQPRTIRAVEVWVIPN